MDKKKLSKISTIYMLAVFGAFLIYSYIKDWSIVVSEDKYELLGFAGLAYIGTILSGIDLAAVKDKEKKVSKKSVIQGVKLALVFIVITLLAKLY
ncbi:hypothetical protein ACVBAX_21565 [Robertmurraya sp. GLU-23]